MAEESGGFGTPPAEGTGAAPTGQVLPGGSLLSGPTNGAAPGAGAGAAEEPPAGTAPPTGTAPPDGTPPDGTPPDGAGAGDQGPPLAAPHEWPAADRERFRGLDRETQQWVLDRTAPTAVQRVAQRWQTYADQLGLGVDVIVDNLMRAGYTLTHGTASEKRGLIDRLIQDHEVPSEAEALAADPLGIDNAIERAIGPLRDELLAQRGGAGAYSPEQQRIDRQMQEFRSERGADGQLLHPHYDEVLPDMELIAEIRIRKGMGPGTLQELYDEAVQHHPRLREELQQNRRQELDRRRQALGGVVGGAGGAAASTGTMNDTLRELLQ